MNQYFSQKMREYDFWLRETRVYPPIPDTLRKVLLMIEEGYRAGTLTRKKAVMLATYLRKKYNIPYRVVSDRHIVFLPRAREELLNRFLRYPQLIAIIGNRHSGKTITAWTIAVEMLERAPETTLYVYGDVDGLGEAVKATNPQMGERIVVKEDYSLPPLDMRKKIVLYNELSESLLSKRALSSSNVELNLQALRSRHLNTWVIYNVIRFSSLEGTLRETAEIKLFKWTTGELLYNAMQHIPKGWREILKTTVTLTENESLVFLPAKGRGMEFFIFETNPPGWLLEAHGRAKKVGRLMMVKSERERYILERIAELKEKGLSGKEIALILEREGIRLSSRSVNMKFRKYKQIVGGDVDATIGK